MENEFVVICLNCEAIRLGGKELNVWFKREEDEELYKHMLKDARISHGYCTNCYETKVKPETKAWIKNKNELEKKV